MSFIDKILFPTDFSETSEYAMEYAVNFAKAFDAELEIVHILFDDSALVSSHMLHGAFRNLSTDLEKGAKEQLQNFLDKYPKLSEINFSSKLLKGTPFLEIINEARNFEADMIVIGTHGRTGIEHVLFGSTAENVVRKAPCPVFTVRLEGKKFTMP